MVTFQYASVGNYIHLASYPGLLAPAFVGLGTSLIFTYTYRYSYPADIICYVICSVTLHDTAVVQPTAGVPLVDSPEGTPTL